MMTKIKDNHKKPIREEGEDAAKREINEQNNSKEEEKIFV